MHSVTPHAEYTRRVARWAADITAADQISGRISNLRLLIAAVAIAVAVQIVRGIVDPWWLGVPTAAFLGLVVWHSRVIERIEAARRGQAWYEHGLARIAGTWAGKGRDGRAFLTPAGDLFAADLDLFGTGSLFQLLDTARTESGEQALAGWLLRGADPVEVRSRQEAVRELTPDVDFRESLAVTAAGPNASRTSGLRKWASLPPSGFPRGIGALFAGVGVATTFLLIAAYREVIDGRLFIAMLVIQLALAVAYWRKAAETMLRIDTAAQDLTLLSTVLARVESRDYQSPRLQQLRASLMTGDAVPSHRIAQLLRLVTWLDSTRNQIFAPIALLLMLQFVLAVAIDRWHARFGPAIARWLDALGDIEAFAALATYAYEHPADPFPVVVEAGPVFEATALGHPLIPETAAIRNDVALGAGAPHLLLVSGSNMSGKSTLLRAIGVNVVLGLAGAPVRAAALRMSPLTLGTALRIEDSLQAGHSRFYAEILRIRAIVELTRQSRGADGTAAPVLFLLDEMLAGTNSHDRRIGAEAIIRSLVESGAIGLVTTHDLALADVVPSMGPLAANVHFEDRIENGAMVFDYRMRPGVVTHSNALALMRAIGLEV